MYDEAMVSSDEELFVGLVCRREASCDGRLRDDVAEADEDGEGERPRASTDWGNCKGGGGGRAVTNTRLSAAYGLYGEDEETAAVPPLSASSSVTASSSSSSMISSSSTSISSSSSPPLSASRLRS